ncbi:monovalent cation/H+ antiporter subunit D [Marichromatium gracile]|uniref:Cation:proton antiporter n=1 Tax=Marichromatium gracile TaxID=1048 RepID=A0ABR5VG49_MARGR|nr:monovalent cation/H+ antiporter subunit D [Marichromatium gracile]KXX64723.1 cation:proton antiporter [Marichromatium gracile]
MSHLVILPLLLPLLAGALLLLVRRALPLTVRRRLNLVAVLAQVGVALALLLAVTDGSVLTYRLGDWPAPYGIVLVADRLSAWMVLLTALLALFALLYAIRGTDAGSRHFQPLFQLQLFGLSGAFLTGDLFNLFVFFEVLLLASYGLLLHGGGAQRTRAGLHFVVVNLVGSTLFLFAAGTLYGVTGTLNMADLAGKLAALDPDDLGLARAGALLLFAVFALKAALFPLYLWLPTAYAATSAPVAALFAVMTKVGIYAILRIQTLWFGDGAGELAGLLDPWLLPLALVTMALGSLGALASTTLRIQIGYLVLVSIGVLLTAIALGDRDSIAAALYYLVHTTLATGAFYLLAEGIARRRGAAGDRLIDAPTMPHAGQVGTLFFIAAILVAGLPPFSGFLGKLMVLRAALDDPAMAWILAVVLTSGLLGIVALARSGSLLLLRAGPGEPPAATPGRAELLPATALLALCIGLTLGAGPLSAFTQATAEQLLVPGHYVETVLGGDMEAHAR